MFSVDLKLSEKSRTLLREMPVIIMPAIFKGMKAAMILAERHARLNASGIVLNRVTGRLRSSITSRVRIEGDSVTGMLGSNVKYARIHELGYTGPEVVKPHFRRQTMAWGKPMESKMVQVSTHVRQMHMPARPYLRPAIMQQLDRFGAIIREHIEAAFEKVV